MNRSWSVKIVRAATYRHTYLPPECIVYPPPKKSAQET